MSLINFRKFITGDKKMCFIWYPYKKKIVDWSTIWLINYLTGQLLTSTARAIFTQKSFDVQR